MTLSHFCVVVAFPHFAWSIMDPPLLCFACSFVGFNWSESGAFISEKSRPQSRPLKVSCTFSTQPTQTSARCSTLSTLRARLNRLRSLEEEVRTCGFITEHEGHFCFVEGTGNRSLAAEADGTFLASKKPPPGLAERCHDIWGSTNQKTKRGNCWTFSFR